mmetsp:Transcript_18608/g.53202  ORF Transcript_18608/g.53202 Transcript_18608/m.53202 type:complete len:246 (-) Transcript_18608:418-1155(-)
MHLFLHLMHLATAPLLWPQPVGHTAEVLCNSWMLVGVCLLCLWWCWRWCWRWCVESADAEADGSEAAVEVLGETETQEHTHGRLSAQGGCLVFEQVEDGHECGQPRLLIERLTVQQPVHPRRHVWQVRYQTRKRLVEILLFHVDPFRDGVADRHDDLAIANTPLPLLATISSSSIGRAVHPHSPAEHSRGPLAALHPGQQLTVVLQTPPLPLPLCVCACVIGVDVPGKLEVDEVLQVGQTGGGQP